MYPIPPPMLQTPAVALFDTALGKLAATPAIAVAVQPISHGIQSDWLLE